MYKKYILLLYNILMVIYKLGNNIQKLDIKQVGFLCIFTMNKNICAICTNQVIIFRSKLVQNNYNIKMIVK